jgi:hypothetical protein
MEPVLGRVVEERQQFVLVIGDPPDDFRVFRSVLFLERADRGAGWAPVLGVVNILDGALGRCLRGLRKRAKNIRCFMNPAPLFPGFGKTSRSAFQNPSAPSPTARTAARTPRLRRQPIDRGRRKPGRAAGELLQRRHEVPVDRPCGCSSGSTSPILRDLRAYGGRIAEENRRRSPVTSSTRLPLARAAVTSIAPALVMTVHGAQSPLRTTSSSGENPSRAAPVYSCPFQRDTAP